MIGAVPMARCGVLCRVNTACRCCTLYTAILLLDFTDGQVRRKHSVLPDDGAADPG